MITRISSDIVGKEIYVREPVDKEIKELLQTNDKRIILPAGRGTGRTTVLQALRNIGISREEQTIYYTSDYIAKLGKDPTTKYNKALFDHYYELEMTNAILSYIKNNYPLLFTKHFVDLKENVDKQIIRVTSQLNDIFHVNSNIPIDELQKTKNLLASVIEKFQSQYGIEKLNLAIDRFDRISNSSKYVQKLHEKYFNLFDKVFLVVDDQNIDTQNLETKGYNIREIDYGKNKDVLREIIRKRIIANNKDVILKDGNKSNEIDEKFYTGEEFMDRIIILGSDISRALEVVGAYIEYDDIYKTRSIGEKMQMIVESREERKKILEKSIERPTLHL